MKAQIAAIASLMGCIVSTPVVALAPSWVAVAKSDNGNTEAYVDSQSITRTGDTVKYWSRIDFENDMEGWKQMKSLVEANCTTRQRRMVQTTYYYVNGTNQSDPSSTKWSYVVPDTIGDEEFNFVCSFSTSR